MPSMAYPDPDDCPRCGWMEGHSPSCYRAQAVAQYEAEDQEDS